MNFSIEPGSGQRAADSDVDQSLPCSFQSRHEAGQQRKADCAVNAQIKRAVPGKPSEAGHVKVGIGAAQVGLLDAHLVPAISQSYRADVFQLYILVIECDA